ncbi:hypothetical protein SDRG_04800 [Saprolegnia diclina VS20]|uniref:WRKY19-like zinc finger domain-containing protein n=1 Tax=Saprolegnia diclina (strain VS20) TaxID=1156394 RepID=T0RYT7_SAPDV|nr:hypothetical protein SDRG_04800 [Saprolegnia diclina VS20]EQC37773.1 hypothetical protein SDRG_04800 [Saprolegnia diclina VS20]|eukprot:XP_008608706.1 hypothetical protein SDRG_04800 [Saprolegnia diclina VS20]
MSAEQQKSSIGYLLNPYPPPPTFLGRRDAAIQDAVQALIDEEFNHVTWSKPLSVQRNRCSVDGCTTAAVSKSLCVRHGGGTRCSEPGCTKRTKRHNRCYLHGGYVLCNIAGCTSKAKRHGVCWAHGGGAPCRHLDCPKLAAKGGLCWTHGGGHRCHAAGCDRRAYKRQNFLCDAHAVRN